jgi:hypothetical protein
MEEQDIVFTRHDKMYVTDFSDWVYNDHRREREKLYTHKEKCRALEAGELLRPLGYHTKHDAVQLVRNGNVMNIPYSVDNIRRFFDLLCAGPRAVGQNYQKAYHQAQ